eukprot:TRINITY_DN28525_c0_g1_i1.p1 TRINITY_DN28525_c0_g1~~TRINITY_DN28525_c0_g1_i1.p1  ORF type:complete len:392 (+),score=74.10 TRINITY_DN28525_c0_g1_i1:25-1176(+)
MAFWLRGTILNVVLLAVVFLLLFSDFQDRPRNSTLVRPLINETYFTPVQNHSKAERDQQEKPKPDSGATGQREDQRPPPPPPAGEGKAFLLLPSTPPSNAAHPSTEVDVTGWGAYRPEEQVKRWRVIEAEMSGSPRAIADYGSNFGFFSVHIAKKFPGAAVFSVQRDDKEFYGGALQFHQKKLKALHVRNNVLCETNMDVPKLQDYFGTETLLDYQLILSIIHWFPLKDRSQMTEFLGKWLSKSKTTFLELPTENGHGYQSKRFKKWYEGGATQLDLLEEAAKRSNLRVEVRQLLSGSGLLNRKLFRVDVVSARDRDSGFPCPAVVDAFKCLSVSVKCADLPQPLGKPAEALSPPNDSARAPEEQKDPGAAVSQSGGGHKPRR